MTEARSGLSRLAFVFFSFLVRSPFYADLKRLKSLTCNDLSSLVSLTVLSLFFLLLFSFSSCSPYVRFCSVFVSFFFPLFLFFLLPFVFFFFFFFFFFYFFFFFFLLLSSSWLSSGDRSRFDVRKSKESLSLTLRGAYLDF